MILASQLTHNASKTWPKGWQLGIVPFFSVSISVCITKLKISIWCRLEGGNSSPQSPEISGLYNIPLHCVAGLCVELYPMQIQPDTIGMDCDKYVPASELEGDQSTEFPGAGKKLACNNRECATRRLGQIATSNAKRVRQWINKINKRAPDALLAG